MRYPTWGAYGASKAALRHLTQIWNEELSAEGIHFLSVDPGDMDTPLHALAVPDADPATLKQPETAARELLDAIAGQLPVDAIAGRLRVAQGFSPALQRERHNMIAADQPVQRPADAKLLVVDEERHLHDVPRQTFVDLLHPGDLVVANDAATLPASLHGIHVATGSLIEVRLAGRRTLEADDVSDFLAVVFGAGDFRTRTETRPAPPPLAAGDRLVLGPLNATVTAMLSHPRFVSVHFDGSFTTIWAGIARHGRPIQYRAHANAVSAVGCLDAHCRQAGSVRTAVGRLCAQLAGPGCPARARHRIYHHHPCCWNFINGRSMSSTAGCRSTNRNEVSEITAAAIAATQRTGGRIVAIGTTVVRALEHAAAEDGLVRAGRGVANQRIGPATRLKVVDAILTGVHERGTSHYELLRAFADAATLQHADEWLERYRYRTHEFGDSVFVERLSGSHERPHDDEHRVCAVTQHT